MNLDIKPDYDPNGDYEKARKSLIEALNDFQKLNNAEKEKLFKEIFTAEVYSQALTMLQQFGNKGI